MVCSDTVAQRRLASYEEGFRPAGLPLFDEDFSASTDVFNRAAPLLALVFVAEMLGAIKLEWSLLANVAAAIAGLLILLGAGAIINLARGRPLGSIPSHVDRPELSAFVIVPALLPLIFGGQGWSALLTALANLALLGLIYAVVGYGLPSIMRWVGRRLWRQLFTSLTLALFTVTVAGEQFQPTLELLKVAAGLGAFSALYFAVAMLTDSTSGRSSSTRSPVSCGPHSGPVPST